MNKTKIEWCDYTWNPVVGCKHGCKYCYARRLNDRFKWLEKWTEPKFYPERIHQPIDKKGGKVFVVSMGDLFGKWVPARWINAVIEVCKIATQHEFMFLTKNPARYFEFDFPDNCWLGITVESEVVPRAERVHILRTLNTNAKKFLSIEPLLGAFNVIDLSFADLIIVGAMTGANAIKPEKEWIESIKHHGIFYKNNIKQYLTVNAN